jgi:dipeptidyl-peptidase-4
MLRRLPKITPLFILVLASTSGAQEERVELDWIFSEEGKTSTTVPRRAWLDNDTVLLYDSRIPKSDRTLETYSLRDNRRRNLVDREKAIADLTAILEPDEPIEEPGWPSAISPDGRFATYEKNGDILLLDLNQSTVMEVVATDADESAARFSPDSTWLAFVRDNDIYAIHLEDRDEKRLTSDGSETVLNGTLSWVYWEELFNRSDRGYAWSPDSSAIAYLQTDESGVGEMHYVHFEPNLPRVIRQRHAKPGEANPRVRAGIATLEDGETAWVDLGGTIYEYLPRFQWLPDSKRLAIQTMNRDQTKLDVFIADASTGEATHLFRESNDGWVNIHDDLRFLGNDEQFVWRSERSGFSHLYRFDLDGELINPVTSGNWALRPSGGRPGMSQAISHVDEEAGAIWFTALEKDSTERHLYRVNLDGSAMRRLTPEDGSHSILFSPDGRHFLNAFSSLSEPPALHVYRNDGERVATVAEAQTDVVARFDLLSWEQFTIPARDGFEMPAMMLKPRYFDPEKQYPVLVYVYGGPSAPTVANAWQGRSRGYYHQLLAESGAIVFYVDNRSAAGKSKTDANSIVRQLYGPVELNDLLDGIAWLKAQPFVDPDRVGIWGWSGGGTMTLQSMTSSKEFVAGAAVAPVTDWHYYDTIYTERYMKRPQDNETGYESTSHVKRAADLHGRLLLVHGTYDDNVHPQNSWAFSDELIETGITFDMMIYPMRKHGISDDAAQAHVYKSMFEFWRRNLGLGD